MPVTPELIAKLEATGLSRESAKRVAKELIRDLEAATDRRDKAASNATHWQNKTVQAQKDVDELTLAVATP